jgi:hypothetical protein
MSIGVCTNDGRYCKSLIDSEKGLRMLQGLALHPRRALMFWMCWNHELYRSEIYRSFMDGSGQELLAHIDHAMDPISFAIDHIGEQLYFGDANCGTIERIDIVTRER